MATQKRRGPKKEVITEPHKLQSVIGLVQSTAQTLRNNWQLFAGITLVYALLSLVLVKGLAGSIDVAAVRAKSGSFVALGELLGSGNPSSQASGVYQTALLIIMSLAYIWALRQIFSRKKTSLSVKDAFYKGMAPLIPFILVCLVILVQLIPLLAGITLYQAVVNSKVVTTAPELIGWGVGALALALVSLYFLAASVFALYIVTLADTTPLVALRSARKLARGRRWVILRKMIFLPAVLGAAILLVTAPFIFIAPAAAQWVFFVVVLMAVPVVHTYMYTLYRDLLHD